MVELGLHRITRLLRQTPQPWKAVHIAGTNGKGSVCAYTSAMLHASGIKCGRFTSPHLVDRWDCITIGEQTISSTLFHSIEAVVKSRNQEEDIKASEFEILTATAFEIFHQQHVDVGVIEVGLGGRHDATNVLKRPAVTVITKIGEDHQALLGNTLEAIARHKAGIMKADTPCLIDGSNPPEVVGVLQQSAMDVRASASLLVPQEVFDRIGTLKDLLAHRKLEPHQIMNIQLAFCAAQEILRGVGKLVDSALFTEAIEAVSWPGRLQTISLKGITHHDPEVLLDGAHNPQSAEALSSYVDKHFRDDTNPVTWLLGISQGKDAQSLLSKLLRPGDNLVAVRFGQVDGMSWVQPMPSADIVDSARAVTIMGQTVGTPLDLREALDSAAKIASNGPLVIAGSLYLVSDVIRLQRQIIAQAA